MIASVRRGLTHTPEPIQLASGVWTRDFIDGKAALKRGRDLGDACRAMIALAEDLRVEFDAVGGLTLGADQFAHVIAYIRDDLMRIDTEWLVVRTKAKGRGTNKVIEAAELDASVRVLLVDDVVTSGGSIRQAYDEIRKTGATVTGAITLVDRGETAANFFHEVGVPYGALVTYKDLNIDPVGGLVDA